jgi:plastocyanin
MLTSIFRLCRDYLPQLMGVWVTLRVIAISAGSACRAEPAVADERAAAAPLKMTCVVHGADAMTLAFVREAGAGGRNIQIIGTGNMARWTVKVGVTDVTPGVQTAGSPGQVKVQVGDTITWTVTGNDHGIAFPTQAEAEALFAFDLKQGKPLGPSTDVSGFKWGTKDFSATTTLAVATVKSAESKNKGADSVVAPLKMTCVVHGADAMTLAFVREAGAGGRNVQIIGTGNMARWTVKVGVTDVTPAVQTAASPGQVKVQAGDTVTWTVTGNDHGIVFPTQAEAEALFAFDLKQGKPLGPSTDVSGFKWGTKDFSATTTLAVATVKAAESKNKGLAAAPNQLEYWIQLENQPWDMSPRGVDRMAQHLTGATSRMLNYSSVDGTITYSIQGFNPIDSEALILRRYKPPKPDGSGKWTIPDDRKVNPWDLNERDPRDRDDTGQPILGTSGTIPGATIECNVGQTVVVHFRNMDRRHTDPHFLVHSLHTHGFVFAQESDGAYPLSKLDLNQEIATNAEKTIWSTVPHPDGMSPGIDQFKDATSSKFFKRGDRVPFQGTFDYTWRTIGWPTTAGVWIYHDHSIDDTTNVGLGAIGFVVIHNPSDPNDVSTESATAELPPGPNSPHSFVGSAVANPDNPPSQPGNIPDKQNVLAVPKQAQYLLLFHQLGNANTTCINGRVFLGNTPTLVAGEATKMRFGVAGMGNNRDGFHTFHIHGHRWVIPGPDGNTDAGGGLSGGNPIQNSPMIRAASQFEDTKVFGPANSFVFTIKEDAGETSFMRAEPALGEWHMHCHVLTHMEAGMMGSLLVTQKGQALDLPIGVKNQAMIEMRLQLFEQMRELHVRGPTERGK